jgi:hypothetical protein
MDGLLPKKKRREDPAMRTRCMEKRRHTSLPYYGPSYLKVPLEGMKK